MHIRKWIKADAQDHRSVDIPVRATTPETHATQPRFEEKRIPPIDGVDVGDAMQRLQLPWSSIQTLLFYFADAQSETLRNLSDSICRRDWDTARRHAHSLAGASGNVSARRLFESAKSLEAALQRRSGNCKELFNTVAAEFERVANSINSVKPANAPRADAGNDSNFLCPTIM